MANRIKDKIRKLEALKQGLRTESIKVLGRFRNDIIRLNTSQFENGIGSDGKDLVNSDKRFKGRYTLYTQMISMTKPTVAPKIAGDLYNFAWTGDFLSGMYVDFKRDGTYKIYSNGMGTDDKLLFFKGYKNLFGLTEENEKKIRNKVIEEMKKYARSRL